MLDNLFKNIERRQAFVTVERDGLVAREILERQDRVFTMDKGEITCD